MNQLYTHLYSLLHNSFAPFLLLLLTYHPSPCLYSYLNPPPISSLTHSPLPPHPHPLPITPYHHSSLFSHPLGNVYCGLINSGGSRQDYVGIGESVNLASRLMGKAHGRVLVDECTYTHLHRLVV